MEQWESHDPIWLVELARSQKPELTWLPAALANCTRCRWRSRAYVYFVDPTRPDEPESSWKFRENITLDDPEEGELVLDVLKGNRVGGIEFLRRALGQG